MRTYRWPYGPCYLYLRDLRTFGPIDGKSYIKRCKGASKNYVRLDNVYYVILFLKLAIFMNIWTRCTLMAYVLRGRWDMMICCGGWRRENSSLKESEKCVAINSVNTVYFVIVITSRIAERRTDGLMHIPGSSLVVLPYRRRKVEKGEHPEEKHRPLRP